jgi:diadenosine tetraphosphate (Ap4A) HIT family hydrolase
MRAMRGHCQGADFCQELSGEVNTEFHRTYGADHQKRIIAQSAKLCVLVDMSPLCVGHLLIVSRDHYLSFAEVMKDHGSEVKDVLEQVAHQYRNTFGRLVVLEHGSSPDIDGSACVTHAHWHLFPLKADAIHQIIFTDGLSCSELTDLDDLVMMAEQRSSYFYVGDSSRHRLYGVGTKMRRQYLRSVAGGLLGIPDPEWDYALVVRKDLFWATMSRVTSWSI